MIKKTIKYFIMIPIITGILSPICLGQLREGKYMRSNGELDEGFPYKHTETDNLKCDGYTALGDCISIKEDVKRGGNETVIRRLLGVFGLDTSGDRDLKFIDYARAIMNIALGLVAFVALIMTIYTFYMIFFSENEAGIKKAKGNLVGIFIALAIIGFARLIVSFIFWWYQSNWKFKEDNIQNLDISEVGEFY